MKLNLTTVRKNLVNEVVSWLLSFLIVWILDTVNMVLLFFQFELKMAVHIKITTEKIFEMTNSWCFFKKS